jgi:hypothetical protein
MRPREEHDGRAAAPAPHASIVDLPSATRLNGEAARRNRTAVLVAIVVVFLAVAYLKPWESPTDRAPGASPSAGASIAPSASPETAATLDWSVAGPVLAPRDAWGLRALVIEDSAQAAAPGASPAAGRPLADRLAEVWVDAHPFDSAGPTPQPSSEGQVVTNAALVPTGSSSVRAIGVTSPRGQPIIDIRLWRIVDGRAQRVDVLDLSGAAPGVDRLLVPPASLGRAGEWPSGTYRFDLLVGRRVVVLTMVLPARPHNRPAIAAMADLARRLPSGLFLVAPQPNDRTHPYDVTTVPASPVAPLSDAAAWLQLSGGTDPGAESATATIEADPSAVGIGIRGSPGEKLISQIFVSLAPLSDVSSTTAGIADPDANGDVAVFELGADGLEPGIYRVDTAWSVDGGWKARSWFVDVSGTATGTEAASPLLAAARHWAGWAGQSVVLADGQVPVAQDPSTADASADTLGASCFGGVMVHDGQKVIGIGYPGARPGSVMVQQLFTGRRSAPSPAAVAADTVPGLLLLAETRRGTWSPGFYQVSLNRDGSTDRYVFCVGESSGDGTISVPSEAWSVEAYRAALEP